MKKISIFMFMIGLFSFVGNSSATSPMPEELMPGQTKNSCAIHVTYILDSGQGILTNEASSTLTFEASISKKDVLDKVTKYINNKLDEGNVSEFKIDCKFQK